jgi:hypothetical protein
MQMSDNAAVVRSPVWQPEILADLCMLERVKLERKVPAEQS